MTQHRHPLTTDQDKQLKHMENTIVKIQNELIEVRKTQADSGEKLTEILKAVKGDDMGNEGFAKRMAAIEAKQDKYDEDRTRNNVYIRIITFLLSIIAVGVLGFLLNVILKAKQ